jgi:tol-pal system protein YbgF
VTATRVLALAISGVLLGACAATPPEEDPAYIKAAAVETRVDRIEQQNTVFLEVQRRLDAAEAEGRRLRGQLEEVEHGLELERGRNRDLYNDLSNRLKALESSVTELKATQAAQAAAVTATPKSADAPPAGPAVPVAAPAAPADHDVYQAALDRLKNRDYAGAERAFKEFLAKYPDSTLADNAGYWLGEAYYVDHRYGDALAAFQHLVKTHADSPKAPGAWLKIGYAFQELKRYREAREALAHLVKTYPNDAASADARERLKTLAKPRH